MTGRDSSSDYRIARDRGRSLGVLGDRLAGFDPPRISARKLLRIYDGGAMPTGPDKVYLGHPVELDGVEVEGGLATVNADTSASVPVVVLWGTPAVGDVVPAFAVGGRWVSERYYTPTPTGVPCGACTIPAQDLTLSWTNLIFGNGSAPLVYNSGPSTWTSGCVDSVQLQFALSCRASTPLLVVTYYLSGSCPTGQSQTCSTAGTAPYKLTSSSLTCGPAFLWVVTVTSASCPNLGAYGYTQFTISL